MTLVSLTLTCHPMYIRGQIRKKGCILTLLQQVAYDKGVLNVCVPGTDGSSPPRIWYEIFHQSPITKFGPLHLDQ